MEVTAQGHKAFHNDRNALNIYWENVPFCTSQLVNCTFKTGEFHGIYTLHHNKDLKGELPKL